MKRLLCAFALAASLVAAALPASAAITVTEIGNNNAAAGGTTLAITTTADCPAGSVLVLATQDSNNITISSVVDGATNTYTAGMATTSTSTRTQFWWVLNNKLLSSGSAITVTWSSTTGTKLLAAACVQGATSRDQAGPGATGSSTAPTITTGSIGISGSQTAIVVGYTGIQSGASDSFTPATGFTPLTSVLNSSALRWSYQIVSSGAAVTYAPTLGTSRAWGVNYLVLKTISPCGGLLLLGAGC